MKNLIIFSALALILINCKSDDSKVTTSEKPTAPLNQFASDQIENVIYPGYSRLEEAAQGLAKEVDLLCPAVGTDAYSMEAVKAKYVQLTKAYHFTEAFQIGRIARESGEMIEELHTFPFYNVFMMDIEVAEYARNENHTPKKVANAMGIPAFDYLIYADPQVNNCDSCGVELLEEWNQRTIDEKNGSRCKYLSYVAEHFHKNTEALKSAWAPVDGDYTRSESFKTDIVTVREFATNLTKHLNFFDRQVKDLRIGIPSGYLEEECGFDSCADRSEHLYSGLSLVSLKYSLKGLVALLEAAKTNNQFDMVSEGYGYQKLLSKDKLASVSAELKTRIKTMMTSLEKLDSNMSISKLAQGYNQEACQGSSSQNREVELCALYFDMKSITNYYKNEFLIAVDLGKPDPATGDPD